MWQLSRQQISWQIIGRKFHLKQNSSRLKKKTGPGQNRNQDLHRPRVILYLQAKLAGNAKKFEYIMKQGTDESNQVLWTNLFTG